MIILFNDTDNIKITDVIWILNVFNDTNNIIFLKVFFDQRKKTLKKNISPLYISINYYYYYF